MSKRGRLFVFEGPDGVGKSTLTRALTEHLNSIGIGCDHFSFPGYEPGTLGRIVYELHHSPEQFGIKSINPTSLQILHIAAHLDAIERYIFPTLESGRNVVLDRFWWSTWVYGKVSGIDHRSLEAILNIEFAHWRKIFPAIVFLLNRSAPLDRDEPITTWNKLCAAYYELADEQRQYYPIQIVNNEHDLAEIFDQIISAITRIEGDWALNLVSDTQIMPRRFRSTHLIKQLNLELTANPVLVTTEPPTATPLAFPRLAPAMPTKVFDTYWRFAAERQMIFFRRLEGATFPWTSDPILEKYKFTNAYRASDRVSQYLIKHVIYRGNQSPQEVFFRIILFKIFNRIETWQLLESKLGELRFSEYSFERYDAVLTRAMSEGQTIFSAAYIMPSGEGSFGYAKKHRNYLRLLETMLADEIPSRISEMRSMSDVFELLRSYPLIGDFLAYQYSIDINYSQLTNFSEMEFVIPGPGARDGIRKCFQTLGGLNEADIIRLMAEHQEEEFARLGLDFRSLWGRPLQLIDCQNLFCEVSKYARLAHPEVKGISDRKRIKQMYRCDPEPIQYWYPPKWEINHLI